MSDQPEQQPQGTAQAGGGAARAGLWLRYIVTLALGAVGGWIFFRLHMPLAWMLGPMTICIVGALVRLPLAQPAWVSGPMIAIVGVMLGSGFTPAMFHDAPRYALTLLGLVLFMVVAGAISVFYLRRFAGYDLATSYFSGMPGGLAEMIVAGEEQGGDGRRIALSHSARIFIVVFLLPLFMTMLGYDTTASVTQPNFGALLATPALDWAWLVLCIAGGILLGRVVKLPAPMMVGPLILSVLVHASGVTDFSAPPPLVIIAQVVLGTAVGSRFVGIGTREILKVLGHSVACNGLIVAATLLFAITVGILSGMGTLPLILAYSPGGLTEMSLMGLALNVEIAFVVTHHIFRVLLVMFSASLVFSLLAPRLKKPD